jgi:hypothetical protein
MIIFCDKATILAIFTRKFSKLQNRGDDMDKFDKIKLVLCYLISDIDTLEKADQKDDILLELAKDLEALNKMIMEVASEI